MNKTQKKTLFKMLTGIISASLIVSAVGICVNINQNNSTIEKTSEDLIIKNDGIAIKFLNEAISENGSITKTFTYTIKPETATNQSIKISYEYEDGNSCDDVITASKNETSRIISVTCLQAFDIPIILKLTSVSNPEAYATITLQFEKKLERIDIPKDRLFSYCEDFYVFNHDLMLIPVYSKFTKDKDYTFSIEVTSISHESGLESNPDIVSTFLSAVKDMVENEKEWTAECWWTMDSRNQWHETLLNFTEDDFALASITYSVICNETNMKVTDIDGEVELPLQMDYSSFETKVSSISINNINLVF